MTTQIPAWVAYLVIFIQLLIGVLIGLLAYWGKRSDKTQDLIFVKLDALTESMAAKIEKVKSEAAKEFQTIGKCDLHHSGHTKEHALEAQMNEAEHRRLERDLNGFGGRLSIVERSHS